MIIKELKSILDSIKILLNGKADKTDVVQSDWSQNDETALDYVKNRTHWVEENEVEIAGLTYENIRVRSEGNSIGGIVIEHNLNIPLQLGQIWRVVTGDVNIPSIEVFKSDDGTLYASDVEGSYPSTDTYANIWITSNSVWANSAWSSMNSFQSVTLIGVSGTYTGEPIVHKLDAKYLPDEAQSDWNQNNPEDAGYIANRTHYDDEFVLTSGTINTAGLIEDFVLTELAEDFVEGKEYIVRINGEDYSTICKYRIVDSHVMYYLGAYPPEMTEESWFSVMYYTGTKDLNAYVHSSVSCPVTIEVIRKDVHQLDEKYIPDTIARVSDIPELLTIDTTLAVEGSAADAKVTGDAINEISSLVGDTAVSTQISNALAEADFVPTPSTAAVGQLLAVKAVDENGKPTEWETLDMVGGEKWEELVNVTLNEELIPIIDIGEVATNFKKIRFFITLESMTPTSINFVLSNIEATSGGQTYVVFSCTAGNESGRYVIFTEFEPYIESGISWRRLCTANEVGVSTATSKSEFVYNSYDTGRLENARYLYTSTSLPSGSTIKITGTRS